MRAAWLTVFAIACGGSDATPDAPANASAHEFCVTETNRYRTMTGRAVVAHSAQLEAYADAGAMIDFNGQPHDHFRNTQGGGIAFAENECPHWNLGQSGGDMKQLVEMCIA